jgi:hypothetical protein
MVFKIIQELTDNSSRLAKEDILRKNMKNKVLQRVFDAALNPMKNYYIRKIPDYSESEQKVHFDYIFDVLEMLSNRDVTGNAAIDLVSRTLGQLPEDEAKIFAMILSKDLRCGVSGKTVNKIWKNLIPEYPVMLCDQYSDKSNKYIKFPAIAQLKLDGMRFNAICNNNKVDFRTRNGKEIDLLGYLEKEFIKLADGKNVVFDGELICCDEKGKFLNRQTSNGILSKTLKGTITTKEASTVTATLWDIIPIQDFRNGKSNVSYKKRFDYLLEKVMDNKKIRLVEYYSINSFDEANGLFNRMLERGEEGLIIKNLESPWENKRVKHQIKMKGELECDLRIVGWQEGTGKNIGKLGALILASSDNVINVSVGSGFTDCDRESIKEDVIGGICAIKYNARIKDVKTGNESLFLPIFIELRADKDKADSSSNIK